MRRLKRRGQKQNQQKLNTYEQQETAISGNRKEWVRFPLFGWQPFSWLRRHESEWGGYSHSFGQRPDKESERAAQAQDKRHSCQPHDSSSARIIKSYRRLTSPPCKLWGDRERESTWKAEWASRRNRFEEHRWQRLSLTHSDAHTHHCRVVMLSRSGPMSSVLS